jgi:hypothetical protein
MYSFLYIASTLPCMKFAWPELCTIKRGHRLTDALYNIIYLYTIYSSFYFTQFHIYLYILWYTSCNNTHCTKLNCRQQIIEKTAIFYTPIYNAITHKMLRARRAAAQNFLVKPENIVTQASGGSIRHKIGSLSMCNSKLMFQFFTNIKFLQYRQIWFVIPRGVIRRTSEFTTNIIIT